MRAIDFSHHIICDRIFFNMKKDSLEENMALEVTYNLENIAYSITTSEEEHYRLQNEPDYLETFIKLNYTNLEMQVPPNSSDEPIIWTNKSTLLLISLLAEKKDDLRNSKKKKKDIWRSIKDEMAKHGLGGFDESTIERKFRNMKNTYKTICDNKKKTATGRGTIKWEYFGAMQDILADDKTINIDHTIASLPILGSCMESSSSILNIEAPSTPLAVETENQTASISIPSPHEIASLIKSPVTSRPSVGAKKEKAQRGKLLYGLRKKQLDLEAERVEELTLLRKAIEENNIIQRRRNELLQLYIEREK